MIAEIERIFYCKNNSLSGKMGVVLVVNSYHL